MHSGGTAQARRIRDSLNAQPELTIILDSSGNPSSRLRARFLGTEGDGLKVQLTTAIGQGVLVSVAGEIETVNGRIPVLGKYQIQSSKPAGIGIYHIVLAAAPTVQEEPPKPQQPASSPDDLDYYEVLQVSRLADTDTIHRIFHVLAQRYHPDNSETGNEDKFRQVAEAHAVLCDTQKRAAYDVRLAADDKIRFKIFDSLQSTQGVQAEIRKRQGILRLLYSKRLTDPYQPAMRGRDFAEMLGCPIEHLEFSLWFLRENNWIIRSDNNRYEITWHGVEAFEQSEGGFSKNPVLPRLTAPTTMD